LDQARSRRIELDLGTTVRGPEQQAKLWCRSHSEDEVRKRRGILVPGAPRLAPLLRDEYAALGPPMTTHMPGLSWHQWGEAADVYVLVGGVAVWDGSLMKTVASIAQDVGLTHSAWVDRCEPRRRQWHVQLRKHDNPFISQAKESWDWPAIDEEMARRFDI
jgi:hypothetical protein